MCHNRLLSVIMKFLAFYLYFTTCFTSVLLVQWDNLNFDDFKRMLSKNSSYKWLQSTSASQNSDNFYCKLCCINITDRVIGKNCGLHTLCKYPTNNTGPACKGYIAIGFTDDERKALLDAHNTLRNRVASGQETRGQPGPQPPAANMRKLEWNPELAMIAERWAAQCIYAHDICRDVDKYPVGQNIAHGNFASNNELAFIKKWFDEIDYFDSAYVKKFALTNGRKPYSYHYTQLVWADTYQIGCARAVFQRAKGSDVSYREHLICNYGPSGNIPNQPIYSVGPSCSLCPERTACSLEYPSLCAGDSIHDLTDQEISNRSLATLPLVNSCSVYFINIFTIIIFLIVSLIQ